MFIPRTRQERVLVRACQLIAEQANAGLIDLLVSVAIAQADGEFQPAPRLDPRHFTFAQQVAHVNGQPTPEDL